MDNKIITECLTKLNSLRLENNAYHSFVRTVNDILAELNQLRNNSLDQNERQKIHGIYEAVNHTLHKEVEFIKYKEDEMRKKNAANIRKKEHYELVSKAFEMMNLDLLSL